MKDPELARKDPYGDGWLLSVQAPDAKINFRNLLGGELARLCDGVGGTAAAQESADRDGVCSGAGWRRGSR